jgi:hypothetical protein
MVQLIACITLIPGKLGKGEVLLRAYECLRLARVDPIASRSEDPLRLLLRPKARNRGVAALRAAGFDFTEI